MLRFARAAAATRKMMKKVCECLCVFWCVCVCVCVCVCLCVYEFQRSFVCLIRRLFKSSSSSFLQINLDDDRPAVIPLRSSSAGSNIGGTGGSSSNGLLSKSAPHAEEDEIEIDTPMPPINTIITTTTTTASTIASSSQPSNTTTTSAPPPPAASAGNS